MKSGAEKVDFLAGVELALAVEPERLVEPGQHVAMALAQRVVRGGEAHHPAHAARLRLPHAEQPDELRHQEVVGSCRCGTAGRCWSCPAARRCRAAPAGRCRARRRRSCRRASARPAAPASPTGSSTAPWPRRATAPRSAGAAAARSGCRRSGCCAPLPSRRGRPAARSCRRAARAAAPAGGAGSSRRPSARLCAAGESTTR